MTENIKQVALRIRTLREIAGESEESLARALRVTTETYRTYESGEADIPVSFLYEIAHRFNVELTALLTGEGPRLHRYCLVRAGEGPGVERRKDYRYSDLAYNFIHKKAETFLVTVEPKGAGDIHCNTHPGQEFNYLIEGDMKVVIGANSIEMHAGDSLYFDSTQQHGMAALNGKPARFLAVII